jgi:hypothetical protein
MEELKMSPETRSEIEDRICCGVAGDEDAAALLRHVQVLEAELTELTKPLEDERFADIERKHRRISSRAVRPEEIDMLLAEVKRLRAGEDTRLLDWALENRAVVVDGTVYKGCSWRTGDLAGFANSALSLAEQRRAALRAAIATEGKE